MRGNYFSPPGRSGTAQGVWHDSQTGIKDWRHPTADPAHRRTGILIGERGTASRSFFPSVVGKPPVLGIRADFLGSLSVLIPRISQEHA